MLNVRKIQLKLIYIKRWTVEHTVRNSSKNSAKKVEMISSDCGALELKENVAKNY